jgi:hypothetical protein
VQGLLAYTSGNFTKVFAQWHNVWWDPDVRDMLASSPVDSTASDVRVFAELHNLGHASLLPGSNVLFMAVVDPQSSAIEAASDDDAQELAMRWLRGMFPSVTIPPPAAFLRTRHGESSPVSSPCFNSLCSFVPDCLITGVDPLSYMSYRCASRTCVLSQCARARTSHFFYSTEQVGFTDRLFADAFAPLAPKVQGIARQPSCCYAFNLNCVGCLTRAA